MTKKAKDILRSFTQRCGFYAAMHWLSSCALRGFKMDEGRIY